jgi:hypothetical protein
VVDRYDDDENDDIDGRNKEKEVTRDEKSRTFDRRTANIT